MENMHKSVFLYTIDNKGDIVNKYFAIEIVKNENYPYIYVEYGFMGGWHTSYLIYATNVISKYDEIVAEKIDEGYYRASYQFAQIFEFKVA